MKKYIALLLVIALLVSTVGVAEVAPQDDEIQLAPAQFDELSIPDVSLDLPEDIGDLDLGDLLELEEDPQQPTGEDAGQAEPDDSSGDFTIVDGVLTKYNGSAANVTVPSGVTKIGERAFYESTLVTSVTLPDGMTAIGDYAFANCYSMVNINIPNGVTIIGASAFSSCHKLAKIAIPGSVTSIGNYAFEYCDVMTAVAMSTNASKPDRMLKIGGQAFYNCEKLNSLTFPDNKTEIGDDAFAGCSALGDVTIPKTVTSIGYGAFDRSDKLVIHGYAGSAAETYAKKNNITFVALDSTATPLAPTATPLAPTPTPQVTIPKKLTLGVKETYALSASGATFKSSKPGVAAVSAKGVITAKKTGSATITVKVGGKKLGDCVVTVVKAPTEISFADKSVTLGVKETLTLKPRITKGSHAGYTWSVKNKKIATVDKDGVVTGVKAGKTTVTVKTHNGLKATITVQVQKAPASVSLKPKSVTLGVKETLTLKPTVPKGSRASYTWSVADKKIATVGKDGKVTGKKAGKTTVTVQTQNGKKASVTVTVVKAPTKVSLGAQTMSLGVKESVKLKPTVAAGTHAGYTWSVKNKKIATVDKNGKLTGVKTGKTTVTVKTHNGKKATMTVNVKKAPTKLTISRETMTLSVDRSKALSVTLPKNTASTIKWSSSNKKVATVDENGRVTGVKVGTAKITAKTFNNVKAVCKVTVKKIDETDIIYLNKIEPMSEEGIDDAEALAFVRGINENISEINKSIAVSNKVASKLEKNYKEIYDSISGAKVTTGGNAVQIAYGDSNLNIENKLFEKLSKGASVKILDTTDDIVLSIGGVKCWAYFVGDKLYIQSKKPANQSTSNGAAGLASNQQTDSDLKKSEEMRSGFVDKTKDLAKKMDKIEKDVIDAITQLEPIADALRKTVNQVEKWAPSDSKVSKIIKKAKEYGGSLKEYLDVIDDKLGLLKDIKGVLFDKREVEKLSAHCTELAARWQESLDIYKHYHLKDSTVTDNYLLNQAAINLDMYINRLWLNYKIDVVLCITQMLAITASMSTAIGKLFKADVASLEKLAAKLKVQKISWIGAIATFYEYVHGELYKRNYDFMKKEDDKLHSYIAIKIVDEETKTPLSNVKITWTNNFSTEERYSDADGCFNFHVLPGGFELLFEADEYASTVKRGVLKVRDTLPVSVEMQQNGVPIDVEHFSDSAFRAYVAKYFDTNENMTLSDSEIANAKAMDVNNRNIVSLQGVEYLTALETLDCSNNKLTSLDVSGCTALISLDCSNNKLISLNVSGCARLQKLVCASNDLTSLDVVGNNALKEINCSENLKMTILDVSWCPQLEKLLCGGVENGPSGKLASLDVGGCAALKELHCFNNSLTLLDVSGCIALEDLDCSWNQLTNLNVRGLSKLAELVCKYNNLTSLNVNGLSNLSVLDCENNKLTNLNVSGLSNLTEVWCYKNKIETLNVSGCRKLIGMNYDNSIITLDASKCVNLGGVYCGGDSSNRSKLKNLNVSGCISLKELHCSYSELSNLNISGCTALEWFDCNDTQLTSLNFSGFEALKRLSCRNNKLTSLNLSWCKALEYLSCDYNKLTSLNVNDCMQLRELNCDSNQLTYLNTNGFKTLKSLKCANNKLTSLSVNRCPRLEELDCNSNQLTSLNVSGISELERLYCDNNKLSSLDVSGCKCLSYMSCENNKLTVLKLSGCIYLQSLYCRNNKLTSVDVRDCMYLGVSNVRCDDGVELIQDN